MIAVAKDSRKPDGKKPKSAAKGKPPKGGLKPGRKAGFKPAPAPARATTDAEPTKSINPGEGQYLQTKLVRVPGEVAEMLDTIQQHKINGWNTVPKILSAAECPLIDWLRPFYEEALEEKQKFIDRLKRPG